MIRQREKKRDGYRLLIGDEYDNHITGGFIGHCIDNDILSMILPPHSSHDLTQSLDVRVFDLLKKLIASKIESLLRTGIAKIECTRAFAEAHEEAFST